MDWMRLALVPLAVMAFPYAATAEPTIKATGSATSHPAEVAFVEEGSMGSVYRETAHSLRLYTYDHDTPNRSSCMEGCASAWPPLEAAAKSEPVGDWTLVDRPDGKQQWAFKGRPVYTRFHDAPSVPTGDGIDGVWHIMPYVPSPATLK